MPSDGEKVSKGQRSVISRIKEDNEALKQRLARESRFSRLAQSMSTSGDIVKLQDQANSYLRKIDAEKKKIDELDADISTCQATIIEQRKKMGGINASKENHDMISRQIRLYENRLDKALVKFNESLAKNKGLRDEIDNLRRERVVFDGIYKKLERELHEKKKEMAAIIEDSKNAYQVRDKSQAEMMALKQQAEREQAEFDREWEELGRIMEQDRLLRESTSLQHAERKQDEHKQSEGTNPGEQANEESNQNAHWSDMKQGSQSILSNERIASFEESFQKIKDATGIKDMHELVEKFLQAEDKNFRLFNFVNSLNSEIERLEVMIADTKAEIEKYKGQGVSTDTQRKKVLRDLEDRLARTESKAEEYDNKYTQATKTIGQLKQGIQSIFTRLGPSRRGEGGAMDERASVEEMLGNQGVTESNMMQYLGIIEQRTSEILQLYYESQNGGPSDPESASATELTPPPEGVLQPAAPRLTVMPPAWEDFSSGEESDQEDDERPLTRDELQRKTLKGMNKKEYKHKSRSFGKK